MEKMKKLNKKIKGKRKHGFRKRSKTPNGFKIIQNRRKTKRKRVTF